MAPTDPNSFASRLGAQARAHAPWLVILAALVVTQAMVLRGGFGGGRGGDGSPTRIAWRTDFLAALDEAEAADKPLLLDFTASWCPPCQMLDEETWPDDRVEDAVAAGFIPVMIDIDRPENGEIAVHYGAFQIPTIVVADATGAVLRQRLGFATADEMLAFLQR